MGPWDAERRARGEFSTVWGTELQEGSRRGRAGPDWMTAVCSWDGRLTGWTVVLCMFACYYAAGPGAD